MFKRRVWPFIGVLAAGGAARLANAAAAVAYPWLALQLGGPAFAGAVAAAVLGPAAVSHFFAGVAVERFGPRACALAGEAASALSAIAIAALASLNQLTAPVFMALAAASAALDGPARVANQARWPEIARLAHVPLPRATALDATTDHASLLLGPVGAGAAITLFGPLAGLWFAALWAGLAFVGVALAMPAFKAKGGVAGTFQGIAQGWSCIANSPTLAIVTAIAAVAVAAFSALESVALPALAQEMSIGAVGLTAYLAGAGIGALTAAAAMTALSRTPKLAPMLALGVAGMALGVAGLPLAHNEWLILAAGMVIGLSYGALGPSLSVVFLTVPPKELRAHVGGLSNALMLVFAPVAAGAAGLAAEAFSASIVIWALAVAMAALAVLSLLTPEPNSATKAQDA
jgi:macrolide resistance protein